MRVIESVRKRTDLVQTDRCTCQEIASAVYRAVGMKDSLLEVSVYVRGMCACVSVRQPTQINKQTSLHTERERQAHTHTHGVRSCAV
jgi:hypothetical protein